MLQAAITESQKFVTGEVRVKLYKGACHVTGRRSEYSLYDDHVASFEDNRAYNHKDAEGFIRLNALRLRVLANSKSVTDRKKHWRTTICPKTTKSPSFRATEPVRK